MDKFSINLPITGEYLTTVRLTTGGICALAGFDVDSAEDFKVCVTESLLILKRNGFKKASVRFETGEALSCAVAGVGEPSEKEDTIEDEISYALLNALLGQVDFEKEFDKELEILTNHINDLKARKYTGKKINYHIWTLKLNRANKALEVGQVALS